MIKTSLFDLKLLKLYASKATANMVNIPKLQFPPLEFTNHLK